MTEKGYSYAVDFWALGIMFIQMLYGEQLDFPPQMFVNNDETGEPKNLAEVLELPRYISPEARSCVIGLLENDPEKRLGSPNSPHGLIRNHPFFKAGYKIDWSAIDEGIFKSHHKGCTVKRRHSFLSLDIFSVFQAVPILSDISVHQPLSTLMLDRGSNGKSDWIAAGQSTCTSAEDERFKPFDYINQSAGLDLVQT